MIFILTIIENNIEEFSMPVSTIYPCVTEKQIFLNGGLYDQKNCMQTYGIHKPVIDRLHDAKQNFKSIMIIDVLNRLRPQVNSNDIVTVAETLTRPAYVTVCANTTTSTTTTTTTTTVKLPSPNSTLSNLTTSNVKRLNSYFMQQNTSKQENSPIVNNDILKFKNFKDINNKLYSLRQFYESQQKSQPFSEGDNIVRKLNESKIDSLISKFDESSIMSNSQSNKTPQTKTESSAPLNFSKDKKQNSIGYEYENFEEKVVNDLDSIISSLSINDYHVTLDGENNNHVSSSNKCSTSTNSSSSSSSSSASSDSDHSSRSSMNGDDPKDLHDDFDAGDSKFHYELDCTTHNNESNGYLNEKSSYSKDDFDTIELGRDHYENFMNLVLHRLPGNFKNFFYLI